MVEAFLNRFRETRVNSSPQINGRNGVQTTSRSRIFGSGEMVDRTRSHDWASTPVGPIENWSQILLTALNLLLTSRFPTVIFWGQDLNVFYNDAYLPLMGDKHPSALGVSARKVWEEAWHILGPQIDGVLDGGTIYQENVLVPVTRKARMEDVYWTYSYSPVYSDIGDVIGVLIVCHDVTEEVYAKTKLLESEARATRILQSIGDAVIVTDANACITRMNPLAEQLTKWPMEEAKGRPLSQVFHIVSEETREPIESPAEKVKRLGSIVNLANHTILIDKDGGETHIDDSGAPIRDEAGDLTGIVLVFRDINERHAAERERAELVEQLSRIQDATTDSILSIDRNWQVTYLNAPARAATGPLADAVGKNFWENFPDAMYEGSPFVENYYRAMDKGIAGKFEAYYPAPLNIWVEVQVRPTTEGIVLFFRDVTQQKEAAEVLQRITESLRASEGRLKAIYDSTHEHLGLLTADGTMLSCNRAALEFAPATLDEVVGVPFWESAWFAGTPGAADLLKTWIERVALGEFVRAETPLIRPNGETVIFDFAISPIFDDAGKVVLLVPEGRDITELKRAEQALVQSEKLAAVGRLAASIAHEINNPLESVTNLLYLARMHEDLPRDIEDYLDIAERELRRAAAITSQTLRFYKQSTRPTPTSSRELFESVLPMYQGRVVNSAVQVEERHHAAKRVLCFEGEIRQVLSNFVGNAIDAMHPRGGRLLLRSREATHWPTGRKGLTLTVADTGGGISAKALTRIFEPFFTTKGIGGTGLGLWVSKEIVERHEGVLRVRSSQKQNSSGTVFTLFLPFVTLSREFD